MDGELGWDDIDKGIVDEGVSVLFSRRYGYLMYEIQQSLHNETEPEVLKEFYDNIGEIVLQRMEEVEQMMNKASACVDKKYTLKQLRQAWAAGNYAKKGEALKEWV